MKWKKLLISIGIPLIIGFAGSLFADVQSGFSDIYKPSFTPPMILFPIVWTILYVLMGISSYLVYESNDDKGSSLLIYGIQLIINSLWTIFFFKLHWFLFSFILVLIILALVIFMSIKFYKINKLSGLLQIPYILWLMFAAFLSFNVYLLN